MWFVFASPPRAATPDTPAGRGRGGSGFVHDVVSFLVPLLRRHHTVAGSQAVDELVMVLERASLEVAESVRRLVSSVCAVVDTFRSVDG